MPSSLVSRLGQRNEFSEFKTVLNDARNQVMRPVDAEGMARELVESGGRDYVEMVRELTTDLANTRQELESANRRYERLVADLAKRGISVNDLESAFPAKSQPPKPAPADNGLAEWEEWDRKFQSLLG